jgi:hypothetical protein
MRRVPVLLVVVALAALAVLAGVTGSTAKPVAGAVTTTAPVTSTELVCPSVDGTPANTTTRAVVADVSSALSPAPQSAGAVSATVLAGAKSSASPLRPAPTAVVGSTAKVDKSVAVSATGSVAASLVADQVSETPTGRSRGLSGVRCESPATDWWFAGADGRVGFSDVLTVANPAGTAAEVTVSLWAANGPIKNTSLEAIRIDPHSSQRLPIARLAPDDATLAIHVHASSGAVTAGLSDVRTVALKSNGADDIPATEPPARASLIPGFAPGKGARYLIVAAPGATDATVNLRLVTSTGSFVPSSVHQLVVRPGHTKAVNLASDFGGATGAVAVSSDQPVVAEGLSVSTSPRPQRPDLLWLAATAAIGGPAGIADGRDPDGGHTLLYLTAPAAAARVTVRSPDGQTTSIPVAAGRSVAVDVTKTVRAASGTWPFVVTPVGAAPVYGVRVLEFAGAHGALITAEPLVSLPKPISLPAVRPDPTTAIR